MGWRECDIITYRLLPSLLKRPLKCRKIKLITDPFLFNHARPTRIWRQHPPFILGMPAIGQLVGLVPLQPAPLLFLSQPLEGVYISGITVVWPHWRKGLHRPTWKVYYRQPRGVFHLYQPNRISYPLKEDCLFGLLFFICKGRFQAK